MYKQFILTIITFSGTVLSQVDSSPEAQNRNALKSIKVIESIMNSLDTTMNAQWFENSPERVDSICYSYKTIRDISSEKNEKDFLSSDLGNSMECFHHNIGNLNIDYVEYRGNLLRIKFFFEFEYIGSEDTFYFYNPTNSFIDSLKSSTSIPIKIAQTSNFLQRTFFEFSCTLNKTLQEVLDQEKGLLFKIPIQGPDFEYEEEVNFVNDPVNSLRYGFGCSVGGEAPRGLGLFAKIAHFGKIYIAEHMLFSPNPVARLMASDAIEYYIKNKNYKPSKIIKNRMKQVTTERTIINTCWGCSYENLTMKEASIKSFESKEHLYDNFFFLK